MEDRIGTCSLCGGPVVVPSMMVNPTPHCAQCGAIPVTPHGPVIPMQQPLTPRGDKPGHWPQHHDIYRGQKSEPLKG